MTTRPRARARSGPPIIDMSEFDETINLLVYGDSGVGKTVLGGSAKKCLILAVEKGTISAKRQGSTAKVWPVKNWKDVEAAQIWLRDGGHAEYDWVVLDSLTVMQEMLWRHILDGVVEANASRDPDIPGLPDHQKMQKMMKRFVTIFCDLPVNVLFTALPMNIETSDGEDLVLPMIEGKKGAIAHFIVGLMSSFGHMHIHEHSKTGREIRRITWKQDGIYTGKDRYGCLAPHTDDTTLPELEALIESSGKKETRAQSRARMATPTRAARRPVTRRRTTRG